MKIDKLLKIELHKKWRIIIRFGFALLFTAFIFKKIIKNLERDPTTDKDRLHPFY